MYVTIYSTHTHTHTPLKKARDWVIIENRLLVFSIQCSFTRCWRKNNGWTIYVYDKFKHYLTLPNYKGNLYFEYPILWKLVSDIDLKHWYKRVKSMFDANFQRIRFLFNYDLMCAHANRTNIWLFIYHIYPTPPLGQDMTQGQFLSEV